MPDDILASIMSKAKKKKGFAEESPEKRVPILYGSGDDRLFLVCGYLGDFRCGCAAGVLK